MLSNETLKKLGRWTGFVAIVTIIGGVLSCLSIVGILPGAIAIFLGIKLWNAKKISEQLLTVQESNNMIAQANFLFEELAVYFKVHGILILISVGISVVALVVGVIMFAAVLVQSSY